MAGQTQTQGRRSSRTSRQHTRLNVARMQAVNDVALSARKLHYVNVFLNERRDFENAPCLAYNDMDDTISRLQKKTHETLVDESKYLRSIMTEDDRVRGLKAASDNIDGLRVILNEAKQNHKLILQYDQMKDSEIFSDYTLDQVHVSSNRLFASFKRIQKIYAQISVQQAIVSALS